MFALPPQLFTCSAAPDGGTLCETTRTASRIVLKFSSHRKPCLRLVGEIIDCVCSQDDAFQHVPICFLSRHFISISYANQQYLA